MKKPLNNAIKKMLLGKLDFNLDYIKNKISNGAIINNSDNNTNTLSYLLKYTNSYIKNNKKKVIQILDLIKLLIDNGALPSNVCANHKMFSIGTNSGKSRKILPLKANNGINPII